MHYLSRVELALKLLLFGETRKFKRGMNHLGRQRGGVFDIR
jgi:hypothetical protein